MIVTKDNLVIFTFLTLVIAGLLCVQAYILGRTRGELTAIEDNTVVITKCRKAMN